MDIFKSTPAKGAVIRDWTNEVLVVDVKNSIGERFHFEVEPNADPSKTPTRSTDSVADKHGKTFLDVTLPIV